MTNKKLAGKTFEKVGENYVYNLSKKHFIILMPTAKGWTAEERRIEGAGKYIGGTKSIKAHNKATGSTLEEAVNNLFEILEPSAQVKASIKYNETNVKQIKLNLNIKTDADIIARLEEIENKQGYIKKLIREDMEK